MARLFIGVMTGTSVDGLDAALVEIEGGGVEEMTARVVSGVSVPLGEWQGALRAFAAQEPMTAGRIAEVCRGFSLLHAEAIGELKRRTSGAIEAACVHGQTVFHQPPVSWQMINAPLIAHTAGVNVVADLRAADLAMGGQGAPLTPLSDCVMFRDREQRESRMVVNLGGFANATVLGSEGAGFSGRDLCACNQLLDLVARRAMGVAFDDGGAAALGAEPDDDALDDLLGMLRAQGASGRSLGTGDEAGGWIGRHWRGGAGVGGPVLAASVCEAVGQVIGDAAREGGVERVIVAGGGVKNAALMRAIESCCSCRVEKSDAHGVPAELREAAGWAVLGALAWDGEVMPLRHVTGASANVRAGVVVRV